jgi:UDP-N-acetylglucosamine 3-dehydrogenase
MAHVTPRIRVALAGLGAMGRQHARVLSELPGVQVVALCDASDETRKWAEGVFDVPVYDDWRYLVDLDVDAIVNALPTPEHFDTTRTFLEAGKAVLVEKPIAATLDEANTLLELAERKGLLLRVGHVERFNPAIQSLRREIEAEALGDIVNVSSRRVGVARPVAPRTNVVTDLAIHDIDICSFLLAEQGRLVFASGVTLGSNQLEDHADLVLRYGGTIASIQANWITPVKIRRLTVTGIGGFAEVDYLAQSLRVFKGVPSIFKGSLWNFFAVAHESEPVNIEVERAEPLRAELEHFLDCVRTGVASIDDARAATQALALAMTATDVIRGRLAI